MERKLRIKKDIKVADAIFFIVYKVQVRIAFMWFTLKSFDDELAYATHTKFAAQLEAEDLLARLTDKR